VTVITLEPFTPSLAEAINEGRHLSNWAVGYPTEGDHEVAQRVCDGVWSATTALNPWGPWAVVHDGIVVGGAGFHGAPDATGCVEVGYSIAEEMRGHGIATAAVMAVIDLAEHHSATRIVAGTDPDNLASARVLEKCGFTRDGAIEEELRWTLSLVPESPA
jgi:RimJ/RimL family protein N-acetyltransferase